MNLNQNTALMDSSLKITISIVLSGILFAAWAQSPETLSPKVQAPQDTLEAKAPVPPTDPAVSNPGMADTSLASPPPATAKTELVDSLKEIKTEPAADIGKAPKPATFDTPPETESAKAAKKQALHAGETEEALEPEPFVRKFKPVVLNFLVGSSHPLGSWSDDKQLGYHICVAGFYRFNPFIGLGAGVSVNNWRMDIDDEPALSTKRVAGLLQFSNSADDDWSFFIQGGVGMYVSSIIWNENLKSEAEVDLGYEANLGVNISRFTLMPGYKYIETWNDEWVHWFTISVGVNVTAPPDWQ